MGVPTAEQNASAPQTPDRLPSTEELAATLRETTVEEIHHYLDSHWHEVNCQIAEPGKRIELPQDWHGNEKYGKRFNGDGYVDFGTNLISLEGTHLPADAFIDGFRGLGFVFEDGDGKQLKDAAAGRILTSQEECHIISPGDERPVIRAINADRHILVEIRNGSLTSVMVRLSRLGNDPDMDNEKRFRYRKYLDTLLGGFSAMGATAIRKRLKLGHVPRDTFMDDCSATYSTGLALWILDKFMRGQSNSLKEMRVGVASTQAIAVSVWYALKNNESFLVRTGGLYYGLGNEEMGSNYLINTLKEMLDLGLLYGVGDMGDRLKTGREQYIHPEIRIHVPWTEGNRNRTTLCLSGGYAMLELLEERTAARRKEPDATFRILQAARVNPPPEADGKIHNWGVLIDGMKLPVFEPFS